MKKRTIWSLLSLLVIVSMLAVACGGDDATATPKPAEEVKATEKPAEEPTKVAIEVKEETPTPLPEVDVSQYKQAPMLDDMDLPPVDERLPANPAVVPVTDSIGEYGGTWHAMTGNASDPGNIKMKMYDPLWRWKPDYTGYEAGLAESFDFNDECTELTWHLREGIKWSDGEPFTSADLQFWWEDMATDDDFGAIKVPWYLFKESGDPADVTFPDDYTMTWSWDRPNCIVPFIIAQGFWEFEPLHAPRHYLEQFHPAYSADGTYEDLELMKKWWENPDHPTIFAWHVTEFEPGQRALFERNPYYWKVDPEGNQLPYIDALDVSEIADKEVRVLELSTGKYDASFRGTDDPNDIPFLAEQAEAGGYHLQEGWMNGAGGWPCWLINQDYVEDDAIRDLLRSVEFRKGLSVAMDRDRIIDVAWGGIGTPQQSTISPQAWHFASPEGQAKFEEWQQADAEYDPDKAMELFDSIGFVDADGDGIRDLPESGDPFELILDIGDWGGQIVPVLATESYAGMLEEVGVKVLQNNIMGQPDWGLRQTEGLYMLRNCHASEVDIWTFPDWIFPLRDNRAWPMEGKWRQTGGDEGWEPEPGSPAAQLQEIYDMGVAEPDVEKRHQLVWDAIDVHIQEGPFTLGAAGDQPMVVIVKDNFHNVSTRGILGPWAPASPGNQHPEQYWIEQ